MDFTTWIKFIEIPVVGVLFTLIWNLQRQATNAKLELAAFKLEVAKNYVSQTALKHLEDTLVERLNNLEAKIERWMHTCAPSKPR